MDRDTCGTDCMEDKLKEIQKTNSELEKLTNEFVKNVDLENVDQYHEKLMAHANKLEAFFDDVISELEKKIED